MKGAIPQIGNRKKTRNELAGTVATIYKVDASYVRRIINGKYKPKTYGGKQLAAEIKATYTRLLNGKKKLVKEVKKEARA